MAATGMGHSWGIETQNDPRRQVGIENLIQNRALALHKEGRTAQQVLETPDDQWESQHPGGMVPDKNDVAQRIRAYESYRPQTI